MNHDRSDERAPKPYAFVPFARQIQRSEGLGHGCLDLADHYSGRLVFRLETLTPVFVGTGSYALGEEAGFPGEKVVRPFYRVNGVPTIPGSSLKGVARSIAEAVSPSCLTVTRVSPGQLPKGVDLATGRHSECTQLHSCPACGIFGRMSQMAKARFADAPLLGEPKTGLMRLTPLFAPRASQAPQQYQDQGRFRGRKFYYHSQPAEDERQPPVEVIPSRRQVEGRVDFENLTPAELGLLCFALGIDGALALKLGGGKPLGLGSLRVTQAELGLLAAGHYTSYDAQETVYAGEELVGFVGKLIDAALDKKVLLQRQALALAAILTFDRPRLRLAPAGPY